MPCEVKQGLKVQNPQVTRRLSLSTSLSFQTLPFDLFCFSWAARATLWSEWGSCGRKQTSSFINPALDDFGMPQ